MSDYWFPFYPAHYRANTLHLTPEQDGLYRRLIDHYMETRTPLPDSNVALARICGVSIECFEHASSILKAFFEHKNGMLYHNFCDQNLEKQDSIFNKRSEIAKKAAEKRWKKPIENKQENASGMRDAMLGVCNKTRQDKKEDTNVSSPPTPQGHKKPKSEIILPDWISETDWNDFSDMRKKIKKPMTDRAAMLIIGKLAKFRMQGHDPIAILQQSIVSGWQDVYEPKQQTQYQRQGQSNQPLSRAQQRENDMLEATARGVMAAMEGKTYE